MSDSSAADAPYRGQDRRGAAAAEQRVPHGRALPLVVGLVLVLVAVLLSAWADQARRLAFDEGLELGQAVLLPGAGILCLVRWQATGLTRPAFVGVALVVLGVFAELLPRLLPPLGGGPVAGSSEGLAGAAAAVAAALLLIWARRAPAVDASTRPGRLLLLVCTSVLGLVVVAVLVAAVVAPPDSVAPVVALSFPLTVLWVAVAVSERQAGLDGRSAWLVPMTVLLALATALQGAAAYGPGVLDALAAVSVVVAGVVAVNGAAFDLRLCLSAQSADLLRLTVDVRDHRERQHSSLAREEERLHEVRNVLAGLHGATATLRKYEDRLDPGVRRRLEDAVSGELRRLSYLFDPTPAPRLDELVLDEVLEAVLVAERELRADVTQDLRSARVLGRAEDIATIVSALLVNVRRHAPGSPVAVWAHQTEDETRLHVDDEGPGIPLAMREAVFERGERGSATAAGTGLGLYTAKRLTEGMGGALAVEARPGGGARFVLTLPSGRCPVDLCPASGVRPAHGAGAERAPLAGPAGRGPGLHRLRVRPRPPG